MNMGIVWLVSIILTLVIAVQKKLGVGGYFLLSIFTGPLAVIIVLLEPSGNDIKAGSILDVKKELSSLKDLLVSLQNRINNLELSVGKVTGQEVAREAAFTDKSAEEVHKAEIETPSLVKSSDMELNFGKNWLNKIGIMVFALGIGFLISYSFKYFGPFLKIMSGYLASVILFYFGFKLETKEKFVNFGRALLGGGWAIVYFTTYAMYHFEASRIIQNQVMNLALLALVVIGMMAHVLKYKSEEAMSVALFVAYFTITLGQITSFTIVSLVLLAFVILFLVYNFQWIKTFIIGIILTYGIHYAWVVPKITASTQQAAIFGIAVNDYHLFMNLIFLTAYWMVFLAGAHIARNSSDSSLDKLLAAANFGNIALYSAFVYPLISILFYSQRFLLVLSAGIVYLILTLIMKKTGRQKLYISDIIAAVFIITFSIPLKFFPTSTLLIWLVEAPFLLLAGTYFKEKIFRYLSYALSVYIAFRMFFVFFSMGMRYVHFLSLIVTWHEFMYFWAAISMGVCFYLTRFLEKDKAFDNSDKIFGQFFSAALCAYGTLLISSLIKQPWITFVLSVESIVLLVVSVIFALRRFKIYSYLVLFCSIAILVTEDVNIPSLFLKWFIIVADVLAPFIVYFVVKYFNQVNRIWLILDKEEGIVFWSGVVLLTSIIFQYIDLQWISLSLGISGVVIILIGILNKNKTERLGGLLLLALTLFRAIFVDLSGLDIIFKIITFIALGVLFIGLSFIYNRFNTE